MFIKTIELTNTSKLTAYIANPQLNFVRKAMLIIPGGGYENVCYDREGDAIAQAFMPYGFNCFVMTYAVNREKVYPAQVVEASLAMAHIKDNADEYGIDKDEVYATGYSAGGHLCLSLGTMWDRKEVNDALDIPFGYNKPKAILPIYPVVTPYEFPHFPSFANLLGKDEPTKEELDHVAIENAVSISSAPAFIAHGANDVVVPVRNSILLADKYAQAGVPFELHIYRDGEHGFATGDEITLRGKSIRARKWIEEAVAFINEL